MAALIFVHVATAQSPLPSLNFIYFGKAEGLRHLQVLHITQDRNSNLWLSTATPFVYRFDGKAFTGTRISLPGYQGSISTLKVLADSKNRLWILTNVGLILYNAGTTVLMAKPDEAVVGSTAGFTLDWNDQPWLIDVTGKVFQYRDSALVHAEAISQALKGKAVGYYRDQHERLCFYSSQGTVVAADSLGNVSQESISPEPGSFVHHVLTDGDDLLVTTSKGLWKFSRASATFSLLTAAIPANVKQTSIDREGRLWMLASNHLYTMDDSHGFRAVVPESNLVNNAVNSLFIDSHGEPWLSVDVTGIVKYQRQPWQKVRETDGYDVTAIVERGSDGRVFYGTYNRGVLGFGEPRLNTMAVTALYARSNGNLLAATLHGSLFELSAGGARQIIGLARSKQSLLGIVEHNGSIFCGGDFNVFAVRASGAIDRLNHGGYSPTVVNDIVYYTDTKSGVNKLLNGEELVPGPSALDDLMIYKIKKQSWGEYLAWGEFSKMIFLDSTFSRTRSVDLAPWLSNILSAEFIGRNQAIVASNDGLFRITFSGDSVESVKTYGKVDGYNNDEFYAGASLVTRDGCILMGSVEGAYRYCPQDEQTVGAPPVAFLTDVRHDASSPVQLDDGYFPVPRSLALAHDENRVTFSFDACSLSNPYDVSFQYMLSAVDQTWTPPGLTQNVTYSNLRPGKYVFSVRAINGTQVTGNVASFAFTVEPAIWQTAWFYLLLIGVAIFLMLLVIRLASAYKLHEHKLQEEARRVESVRLRKQMSMDFHDEMGNKLAGMLAQSSLLRERNKGTAMAATFEYFEKTAQSIYQGTRDFIWTIDVKSANLMAVIAYLRDFGVNQFEKNQVAFHVETDILDVRYDLQLAEGVNRNIILIFKEAMTNALRHAQCHNVYFNVAREGDRVVLGFRDDGVGHEATAQPGHGMSNMFNRAEKIGAVLRISSAPGKGTLIQLEIKKSEI